MLAERLLAEPQKFSGGWNFGPEREDHKPVSWIVGTCSRLWGNGARWEIDTRSQPYEAKRLGVTIAKAELWLAWRPHWRIEVALQRTINWYRAALAGKNMLNETLVDVRQVLSGGQSKD
jgi:CDP-glucose 4,6-dehydratase